jgi:hypothetical protein
MTKRGTCKLCMLEKDLQDSHFIGKAVYKKLMEPFIRNPQPIVITSENLKQSPVQLRDAVFCSDCEQIFNLGANRGFTSILPRRPDSSCWIFSPGKR